MWFNLLLVASPVPLPPSEDGAEEVNGDDEAVDSRVELDAKSGDVS